MTQPAGDVDIREASVDDVPATFAVRMAVRENRRTEEQLVAEGITEESVRRLVTTHGRAWVAESDGEVVGYVAADGSSGAIAAIFVRPEFEGRGIGRRLLARAVEWLQSQKVPEIWLRTGCEESNRAHRFYRSMGWVADGRLPDGDVRYVLAAVTRPTG